MLWNSGLDMHQLDSYYPHDARLKLNSLEHTVAPALSYTAHCEKNGATRPLHHWYLDRYPAHYFTTKMTQTLLCQTFECPFLSRVIRVITYSTPRTAPPILAPPPHRHHHSVVGLTGSEAGTDTRVRLSHRD